MKVLGIIPAREGSKGLPDKNTKIINRIPLIGWTIHQALQSKIDKVIVSTDGVRIASVARECGGCCAYRGAEVLIRPKELAQDDSPVSETILHAIENYPGYDAVALLEPTSPLRKPNDIDNAIKSLKDADSIVSVGEIHTEHPLIVKQIHPMSGYVRPYQYDGMLIGKPDVYQRQQLDKAYFPYGVIYIARVDYYLEHKTFYSQKALPYFIDRWQNYEIDDDIDFIIVENLIKWAINNNFMEG